ncbi:MAG TPA: ATP-binding protein, partial [bacterium]|nr:ATP-binding protein [bacterium]
ELLTRIIHDDETLVSYAQQIHHATDRAKDLTQQLLAFGRKQTLKMETIDSGAAISKFEKILRRTIREDIDLQFHLKPESGHIRIDQSQIGQVIVNLAVNAQDAMPEGGRLTIGTDNIKLSRREAQRIPELVPGSCVLITISDTGEGIDSEILPQIFEPFFTTKRNGEGTGLGLATVYGIVKQHQGHISVVSEKGHGTTFRIYLPLVEPDTDEPTRSAELSRSTTGEETILITEDDDMVRNYVRNLLMEKGYQVIDAGDGTAAIKAVEKQSGDIDLLISDVIMPGMNGKELYDHINDRYPDIKVLYISGYTDDVISKHGILERGISFLQKPFSNKQLMKKIREILDS